LNNFIDKKDWNDPEWLRYFGLDAGDVNGDDCIDVISGRYIYHNPCGDMTGEWARTVLDDNVDAILFLNVDDDPFADIIAQSLPDIYWYEAINESGTLYRRTLVTQVPATSHVNSQGFEKTQMIPGGKEEILMAGNGNIYCITIPEKDAATQPWPTHLIAKNTSDEGIGYGDIDGDGDLDIAAGRRAKGEGEPKILVWFENAGSFAEAWKDIEIGHSIHPIDRVEIVDLNGDQKSDIVVTEERYPGLEPDGSMYWFEQRLSPLKDWEKHTIVTQYSMNNLDVADLDKDGDMDLVTNEHKGEKLELQWWKNDGKGHFQKNIIDTGKENHLGTQLVDLDKDGDLDIIGAAWDAHQYMHVWRNDEVVQEVEIQDAEPRSNAKTSIDIFESEYEGRPHFVIKTPKVTYYFDKAGGGFSRIIDPQGNDWIGFKKEPWDQYPASAASAYRGLPNLVFKSEDGGAGHPGHDKCTSRKVLNEIITESKSGDWKWSWKFFADYAVLEVLKIPANQNYWFLYEGTPGGKYDIEKQYFGTNRAGFSKTLPDFYKGASQFDQIQWAYFGKTDNDYTFFLLQDQADHLKDVLGYLGNSELGLESKDGMTVFGFGRDENTKPLLSEPQRFTIGFYNGKIKNEQDHKKLEIYLKTKFLK